MLTPQTARILIISFNQDDSDNMRDFFSRLPFDLSRCKFVVGQIVPTDGFDFAVFNAMVLPRITDKTVLSTEEQRYLDLFRLYLNKPVRYVVYYGEFLYDLDRERCPSANSRFTLFARIRELIDFINNYREG